MMFLMGAGRGVVAVQGFADFDLLDVPDVFGVLIDGAVAAELARSERIHYRHLGPLVLVQVGLIHFLLGSNIGLEVGRNQIPVVVVGNRADQAHQQLLLSEGARSDSLDSLLQLRRDVVFRADC